MPKSAIRFCVFNEQSNLCAASWKLWSVPSGDSSFYIACRELSGAVKLSLHESGRWHVAYAKEHFDRLFEEDKKPETRFIRSLNKPNNFHPGWTLAVRIQTPWFAVSTQRSLKDDFVLVESPKPGQMSEICVLILERHVAPVGWPGMDSMGTSLVGHLELKDKSNVWVVNRLIDYVEPSGLKKDVNPHFFKGKNAASLLAGSYRSLIIGDCNDGAVGLFDTTCRLTPK